MYSPGRETLLVPEPPLRDEDLDALLAKIHDRWARVVVDVSALDALRESDVLALQRAAHLQRCRGGQMVLAGVRPHLQEFVRGVIGPDTETLPIAPGREEGQRLAGDVLEQQSLRAKQQPEANKLRKEVPVEGTPGRPFTPTRETVLVAKAPLRDENLAALLARIGECREGWSSVIVDMSGLDAVSPRDLQALLRAAYVHYCHGGQMVFAGACPQIRKAIDDFERLAPLIAPTAASPERGRRRARRSLAWRYCSENPEAEAQHFRNKILGLVASIPFFCGGWLVVTQAPDAGWMGWLLLAIGLLAVLVGTANGRISRFTRRSRDEDLKQGSVPGSWPSS